MRIGLIDVDGHNYPNLALMKISAFHKRCGDAVEWYSPISPRFDKVYVSKVFSFTDDYEYPIYADEIIYGGTGYCISLQDGKEVFDQSKNNSLSDEIEHIYPDYDLYPQYTQDKAFGYLTRGCPRGCDFCHVKDKEGRCSVKVADLKEFWNGQKHIILMDANTLACKDWKDLLQQLIDSKAKVEFNQGVDIRLLTDEKADYLKQIKLENLHFAWDNPKENLEPRFKAWADKNGGNYLSHGHNGTVFCLTNFNSTHEEDIHRVMTLKSLGYAPYVMIYDKEHCDRWHRDFARYVNNPRIFWSLDSFEEYDRKKE